MVTWKDCVARFGLPKIDGKVNAEMQRNYMDVWHVPKHLRDQIPCLPRRIFLNKQLQVPLEAALIQICNEGLAKEIKTWDGCFVIRKSRGLRSWSLHSWGIAVDVNAEENGLYMKPKMHPRVVEIFKANGFDWGGDWKRKDGMHFQLSYLN
jgi:hypothetical protein